MRILGADSFFNKSTSINAIPVNLLKGGDICILSISNTNSAFISAIYYYEYIENYGQDESVPLVIVPLDNFDTNHQTGGVGDNGARWVLKDVYTNKITTGEVVTNTITPSTSGTSISIGDDFTVHDHGVTVDGQVTINSSDTEPPLIVNSSVMVENLNANYLRGWTTDDFLLNDDNAVMIPNGVDELDVYMTNAMIDLPHYTVMLDMCNLVDSDPSIYSFIITKKEEDFFRVRFSGIIDSPNYTLHYFLIGRSEPLIPVPSGGPLPSGSPSGG